MKIGFITHTWPEVSLVVKIWGPLDVYMNLISNFCHTNTKPWYSKMVILTCVLIALVKKVKIELKHKFYLENISFNV